MENGFLLMIFLNKWIKFIYEQIFPDHTKFNFLLIKKYSKCIVDTRGVYPGNYKHIIKA